jgi:hypothetical protein
MSIVRGSNPVWFEVDLTAHAFDDTYWLFVLENVFPYIPSTSVWHNADGTNPWNNPIQFLGNGTLPIDIFFDSTETYRLEFRQGQTQEDPLIYEVDNYRPGGTGITPISTVAFASSNQVTNPQFSIVNFSVPYTVSGSDLEIDVAPGWTLILPGTGTAVIEQVAFDDTNTNPSNAPYALHLTLTGWTDDEVVLRQRFEQNGMLWANKIVSSTLTARIQGSPQNVSANLVDSNDTTLANVLDSQSVSGTFVEFLGYGTLGDTTNPDDPPAAYIDYVLSIPSDVDIYLTSIQLVVQEEPFEPPFEQDSINRQIDHTFNYYKDLLAYKPIPSYLVGWDFALNPAQLGSSIAAQAVGANKSYYAWDQTIVFQSANSGITISREVTAELFRLLAATDTQMAVIQYLTGQEAQSVMTQLTSGELSVNVEVSSTISQTFTVSLWWTPNAALPNVAAGTNASLVSALDANGHPSSVVAGWVEVDHLNLGNATVTTTDPTEIHNYGFSHWADSAALTNGKYFAIVIGTNTVATGNAIQFRSISLVPGVIPTTPAPQTSDEVLRECQRYYETTFLPGATVPSSVTGGQLQAPMVASVGTGGTNIAPVYANTFGGQWVTPKWSTPNVIFYSGTSTTANKVQAFGFGTTVVSTAESGTFTDYWASPTIDSKAYRATSKGTTSALVTGVGNTGNELTPAAWIQYHYTSDCRPGIVLS